MPGWTLLGYATAESDYCDAVADPHDLSVGGTLPGDLLVYNGAPDFELATDADQVVTVTDYRTSFLLAFRTDEHYKFHFVAETAGASEGGGSPREATIAAPAIPFDLQVAFWQFAGTTSQIGVPPPEPATEVDVTGLTTIFGDDDKWCITGAGLPYFGNYARVAMAYGIGGAVTGEISMDADPNFVSVGGSRRTFHIVVDEDDPPPEEETDNLYGWGLIVG